MMWSEAGGRLAVALAVVAALMVGAAAAQPSPPQVDTAVPDFGLPDLDGVGRTLSEQTGAGPVVLIFFRGAW